MRVGGWRRIGSNNLHKLAMTIEDIRKLISGDETRQVELKKTTGELKDAMHSACAFLNTDGGWLIFGVTPVSLKIVGQEVTENTRRELAQALAGLEPAVDAREEYVDVPDHIGQQLIALHFDGWVWGKEPFTYHGLPYYRVESVTKMMPREMYDERLRASKPHKFAWERQPAEGLKLEDLNQERIRGAVRLGVEMGRMSEMAFTEPGEKVLEKWRLLTDGVPNNAAAMLFTNDTYNYPQFILRLARFRGNDKIEFVDNQRVEGNFFVLLDAGMSFFFKHLSLSGKIVGFKREEHLEIPSEALREALINALCHRQYEKYNLTIGIAIYDDRIEIENPGMFPPQITLANIKESHGSYPYNPLIAEVLYKTSYLESWGSGVKRIIDACRKQNVQDPEWSMSGGFVTVTFRKSIKSDNLTNNPTNVGESDSKITGRVIENREKVIEKVIEKASMLGERVTENKIKILRLILETPTISKAEISKLIGISENSVSRNIEAMRNKYIRRVGSDRGGYWEVIV